MARRERAQLTYEDDELRAFRQAGYRAIKQSVISGYSFQDVELIRDFDHLPLSFLRVNHPSAAERLLADPRVKAVYEDVPIYPHLSYSLPLIGQPELMGAGMGGDGVTIAVIDTGINYTLPAFGSCSAAGAPAGCRVAASVDVTGNNLTLNTDPRGHGTNVAAIAAGLAGDARIAAVNAFSGGTSKNSWVLAGINWAIANKSLYNIGVLNLSLGDGTSNSSPCGNSHSNPYVPAVNNLRAAGIIPVASSGNNGYTNGISAPACTPGVVSVGAVYDANWGGPYTWSVGCTDSTTATDQIPCFSNSASFLSILAPGAFITAAGIQMAGTSQASPHVAGAVAVLRGGYPAETLTQTISRLTSGGLPVIDNRNGIATPRLNLVTTITPPANDQFAQGSLLNGDAGNITTHNIGAAREAGEPNHAGNSGGRSVWWRWTPSISGVASFDTHGSSFNTLLAVYTGATLTSLNQVLANDDDGDPGNTSSATFTVLAGQQYFIAVDGFGGASGGISLNWNVAPLADLAVSISQGPGMPVAESELIFQITVSNGGPSPASGVVVTDLLSAETSLVSVPNGCSASGTSFICTVGTMEPNTSATITLVVSPSAAGDLTSSVQVSSAILDSQSNNNSAFLVTSVSPPAAVPGLSRWGMVAAALCLAGLANPLKMRCGMYRRYSGRKYGYHEDATRAGGGARGNR